MRVSDVQITLANESDTNDNLLAYAVVTFDGQLMVHDVKVIDSRHGPFVVMPNQRIKVACPRCRVRNPNNNNYCGHCGREMPRPEPTPDARGNFRDVTHPTVPWLRTHINEAVLETYYRELDRKSVAGREVPT